MAAESAALAEERGGRQVRRWQQQDGEHQAGWSALGSEQQQAQLAAQQQGQQLAEESGSSHANDRAITTTQLFEEG